MKTKIGFQDSLSLNAGQKYCRMLQGEHSAKLSTFIKLPLVIKIFVLSIFVWPLKTGFTVLIAFSENIHFIQKAFPDYLAKFTHMCRYASTFQIQ